MKALPLPGGFLPWTSFSQNLSKKEKMSLYLMKYQLLHELIDFYEKYEQEGGSDHINDFAFWLNTMLNKEAVKDAAIEHQSNESIARSLGMLYKHARHYVKTALADSQLIGGVDFAFLGTLYEQGDLRKSELIKLNLSEFSPGMEVIRRLLRKSLITDYDDPDDGRSKKVKLTEEGQRCLEQAFSNMTKASIIINGPLTQEEKTYFIHLARKLLNFHQPIWDNDQSSPLEDIQEKYLST
jgi:DNA-binding MarR family transcriptional regulator